MQVIIGLFINSRHYLRVAVPNVTYADTAYQVQVGFAIGVVQVITLRTGYVQAYGRRRCLCYMLF